MDPFLFKFLVACSRMINRYVPNYFIRSDKRVGHR